MSKSLFNQSRKGKNAYCCTFVCPETTQADVYCINVGSRQGMLELWVRSNVSSRLSVCARDKNPVQQFPTAAQ